MQRLLARVGMLPEHLNRYPHEFSGGQRQRIAIARALAVNPKLIICDEPTSALDVSIRGQVLDLLRELQDELGVSYLFITHDLSIIPHLAHRVAVMKNGQIVEQGATEQIMQSPQHPYTQQLLAAAPRSPLEHA
jgi:peptide/nickel transport system ATP-binding protein